MAGGDTCDMRLVSWNVAGHCNEPKAPRLTRQADAIASERPDIVALQEVTRQSDPQWREALSQRGLSHIASTTHLLTPGRRYANLLAARRPLSVLSFADPPENDFPERLLSTRAEGPAVAIEIHVFHAPTGVRTGWGKIRALEALHRRLLVASAIPRVVCGDFTHPGKSRWARRW
jgi:endonuclease/exonuclease/phosphatase family metal-dependent hydrolase